MPSSVKSAANTSSALDIQSSVFISRTSIRPYSLHALNELILRSKSDRAVLRAFWQVERCVSRNAPCLIVIVASNSNVSGIDVEAQRHTIEKIQDPRTEELDVVKVKAYVCNCAELGCFFRAMKLSPTELLPSNRGTTISGNKASYSLLYNFTLMFHCSE